MAVERSVESISIRHHREVQQYGELGRFRHRNLKCRCQRTTTEMEGQISRAGRLRMGTGMSFSVRLARPLLSNGACRAINPFPPITTGMVGPTSRFGIPVIRTAVTSPGSGSSTLISRFETIGALPTSSIRPTVRFHTATAINTRTATRVTFPPNSIRTRTAKNRQGHHLDRNASLQ